MNFFIRLMHMKKHFLAGLAVVLVICSCSLSSLNPFGGDEKKAENETGVNHYLWQASLDKLSFMPLATVDATSGLIVTDWAAMGDVKNEQFKINVQVLSKELRVECLKVSVFKRVLEKGQWVDAEPDERLSRETEKAILVKARQLYRNDLAAGAE